MSLRTKFSLLVAFCTLLLLGAYFVISLNTAQRAILGFNARSAIELSTSILERSTLFEALDQQDLQKPPNEIVAKLSNTFDDHFFVILEDDEVASENVSNETRSLSLSETSVGYQFQINQNEAHPAIVQVSRPQWEFGNRKLFYVPKIVLTQQSEQRALERRLSDEFLWALVGLSSIAIFLSWLGAGYFLKPLERAQQGFQQLKEGQFDTRLSVDRRDEVGQLVQGFNDLATWLDGLHQQYRQMNSDLAHELRSPLNAISSRLEAIEDGLIEPSPEQFQQMRSEISALTLLVEDLRLLSLVESSQLKLQLEPVSLNDVISQVIERYQPSVDIQLVSEAHDITVFADAQRTRQILVNLIDNALQYGSAPIEVAIDESGSKPVVKVSDHGAGINDSDKTRIFERFFRKDAARSDGGLGLGLAISRQLARLQGGDLNVEDHHPTGATFVLGFAAAGNGNV